MRTFSGTWPALVTPFTAQDTVNTTVLRELVDYLVGKRIGGLYVCGTTGEGLYMSQDDRKLVTETGIFCLISAIWASKDLRMRWSSLP